MFSRQQFVRASEEHFYFSERVWKRDDLQMRHSMTHPETFLKDGRMYVRAGADSSKFWLFFARDGDQMIVLETGEFAAVCIYAVYIAFDVLTLHKRIVLLLQCSFAPLGTPFFSPPEELLIALCTESGSDLFTRDRWSNSLLANRILCTLVEQGVLFLCQSPDPATFFLTGRLREKVKNEKEALETTSCRLGEIFKKCTSGFDSRQEVIPLPLN